jgi:hypothetical protein
MTVTLKLMTEMNSMCWCGLDSTVCAESPTVECFGHRSEISSPIKGRGSSTRLETLSVSELRQ